MTTILQLSDLHFGSFYVPHAGEAALEFAHANPADLIVLSGDFTQRAKRQEFADAKRFIDALPSVPKVIVPGNHDVPLYRVAERVFSPYGNYREFLGSEDDSSLTLGNVVIAAINSTAPLRAITNGRISRKQLQFVADVFKGAPPNAAKVLVAHHHLAPAPDYDRAQIMPGAREVLGVLQDLEVELILGGHLHRAYIGNALDVYPAARRSITIVQCGTTTSRRGRGREREKNTLNMISVEDGRVRITHHLLIDQEGRRFRPTSDHIFPRSGLVSLA